MRRSPDKEVIIKLRSEGMTFEQIGKQYGVATSTIQWAFHYVPRIKTPEVCHIPPHVIDYWRTEWGWSDQQIDQKIILFNQSLRRR